MTGMIIIVVIVKSTLVEQIYDNKKKTFETDPPIMFLYIKDYLALLRRRRPDAST